MTDGGDGVHVRRRCLHHDVAILGPGAEADHNW